MASCSGLMSRIQMRKKCLIEKIKTAAAAEEKPPDEGRCVDELQERLKLLRYNI